MIAKMLFLIASITLLTGCVNTFSSEKTETNFQYNATQDSSSKYETICENITETHYSGDVNRSCFFDGCNSECKKRKLDWCYELFGDDDTCRMDYADCVWGCTRDLDYNIQVNGQYLVHHFGCYINETINDVNVSFCHQELKKLDCEEANTCLVPTEDYNYNVGE